MARAKTPVFNRASSDKKSTSATIFAMAAPTGKAGIIVPPNNDGDALDQVVGVQMRTLPARRASCSLGRRQKPDFPFVLALRRNACSLTCIALAI